MTGHKLSLNLPFYRDDLNIQAFTWIRDPVDRFLSHYFYNRHHTTLIPEAKTMDLIEYTEWALALGHHQYYINGQTKCLSGGSLEPIRSMVKDGKLLLFPLAKLQQSFYTLANKFPETFLDIIIKTRNVSNKDQIVPDHFRDLVLPYVNDDLSLLELANQTILENSSPLRQNETLLERSKEFRNKTGLKISQFLMRAGRIVDKNSR